VAPLLFAGIPTIRRGALELGKGKMASGPGRTGTWAYLHMRSELKWAVHHIAEQAEEC